MHLMRRTGFWQILSATLAVGLALTASLLALERRDAHGELEGLVRAGIALDDFTITLPDHPLPAGVPLRLDVTNQGRLPHDVVIDGVAATVVIEAGEVATLDLGMLQPGVYRVHCDVEGHVAAGMEAELTVADARARDHDH